MGSAAGAPVQRTVSDAALGRRIFLRHDFGAGARFRPDDPRSVRRTRFDRAGNSEVMDVLGFRDYCLSLPLSEESTPFDETTLVCKIGGRMYACADRAESVALRSSATPGRR